MATLTLFFRDFDPVHDRALDPTLGHLQKGPVELGTAISAHDSGIDYASFVTFPESTAFNTLKAFAVSLALWSNRMDGTTIQNELSRT